MHNLNTIIFPQEPILRDILKLTLFFTVRLKVSIWPQTDSQKLALWVAVSPIHQDHPTKPV